MNRRQRILQLERQLADSEEQRKMANRNYYDLSTREFNSLTLLKQIKDLVSPKSLTLDAENLAKYLTTFPKTKHCRAGSCTVCYSIPKEELDRLLIKEEDNA